MKFNIYQIACICILLENSQTFTSFGGSFVQFQIILVELQAFEGRLSLCNQFLDSDLLL